MKKVFSLLLVCLIAFGCRQHHPSSKQQSPAELPEKPFVVIIPSYNNTAYCEQNLSSVLKQDYHNFRVIYIDDASKDDTYEKVQSLTANSPVPFTLIHNETNQGALYNLYHAIQSCKDDEIIVTVDGDDFLAHTGVLKKLNQVYADPKIWMTYGNYLDYPSYKQKPLICKKTPQKVVLDNSYRTHEWTTSHLRTFYASLFKQIKLGDLVYKGRFLPMGWDVAFMLPMLEMSGKHAVFIRDVLYLYNRSNPINDHKINFALQSECANYVRSLHRYKRLQTLPTSPVKEQDQHVDLVIFSSDRPIQLYALLESANKYVSSLDKTYVFYCANNDEVQAAYQKLSSLFPKVTFLKFDSEEGFQPLLMQTVFADNNNPYVLFAQDDSLFIEHLDLKEATAKLQKTAAYGFYLSHSKNLTYCHLLNRSQEIPSLVKVDNGVYSWRFKEGQADWKYPNSLEASLYRKKTILKDFEALHFNNPLELEQRWSSLAKNNRLGLIFETAKMVNLADSREISQSDLLKKFHDEEKINISPLHQVKSQSRYIDHTPSFIKR